MNYITEIIITLAIIFVAALLLINSIRKKAAGKCDCSSCSSHCPNYKNSDKNN